MIQRSRARALLRAFLEPRYGADCWRVDWMERCNACWLAAVEIDRPDDPQRANWVLVTMDEAGRMSDAQSFGLSWRTGCRPQRPIKFRRAGGGMTQ